MALADTFFLFREGTSIRIESEFRALGSLDGYSEAIVVRAADRFAAEGFTETVGLPDAAYGGRYSTMGITGPSGIRDDDTIYHGDPPGPHWIAGLAFMLWGGEHLGRTRLIPVTLAIAAAIALARTLARTLGNPRALFVLSACAVCPMFTNMSNSLYYHSYALSLLMLQIAVLLDLFVRPGPAPRAWPRLAALGLIGFAQGYLSYCFAGVVALAAIPIALLAAADARPVPRRLLAWAVVVPAAAFATAHLIHFGQSVLYFGSVREALAEYAFRGRKTYVVDDLYPGYLGYAPRVLLGLRLAMVGFFRQTHLFMPASPLVVGLLVAVLVVRRASGTARPRWCWELASRPTRRRLLGLLVAIAAGASWFILKPSHAITHIQVVSRAFFLPYLGTALFLAMSVRLRTGRLPRPTSKHKTPQFAS